MPDPVPSNSADVNVAFHESYVPQLEAGNYRISVTQELPDVAPEPFVATQDFTVTGPQFSIDAQEIHALYPPAHATGKFADCLPHIVFNRPVVPWERAMPVASRRLPWLALFVFDEAELVGADDSETRALQTTVGAFLDPNPPSDRADHGCLKPALAREADVPDAEACFYIKVPTARFKAIAPRLDELPYLAHIRRVDTTHKVLTGGVDEGTFALVVANRFPQPARSDPRGAKTIVHLVSLEGLAPYLEENAAFTSADGSKSFEHVALLSLARWSFHCLPDPAADFEGLMQAMVTGEKETTAPATFRPERLWLRLDPARLPASAPDEARARIAQGFVPLPYHARSGEDTFAWYRGPLTPLLPGVLAKSEPFTRGDAAIIYDAANGAFDHSLAAAWQIGRTLALADAAYAQNLVDFRRRLHRLTDRLHQRLHRAHIEQPDDLKQLADSNLLQRAFLDTLHAGALGRIGQPVGDGSPRPTAPARERADPVTTLKDFLSQPRVIATIGDLVKTELKPVAEWLADLLLLQRVPFEHLVPAAAMLPAESIRFFHVDPNWTGALLDGALTPGRHASRDDLLFAITKDLVRHAAEQIARERRDRLRGVESPPVAGEEIVSGILLRSAIVAGWPGLTVVALDASRQPLKPLRIDRLGPDVLLALFAGAPARVTVGEPHEGLRFGVDQHGQIELRNFLPGGDAARANGEPIGLFPIRDMSGSDAAPSCTRAGSRGRVLRIEPENPAGLVATLAAQLKRRLGLSTAPAIGPAELALQLINAPEEQSFDSPA